MLQTSYVAFNFACLRKIRYNDSIFVLMIACFLEYLMFVLLFVLLFIYLFFKSETHLSLE